MCSSCIHGLVKSTANHTAPSNQYAIAATTTARQFVFIFSPDFPANFTAKWCSTPVAGFYPGLSVGGRNYDEAKGTKLTSYARALSINLSQTPLDLRMSSISSRAAPFPPLAFVV